MTNMAPINIRIPACLVIFAFMAFVLGVAIFEGKILYIASPTKLKDVYWIDASYGFDFWLSLTLFVLGFLAFLIQLVKDLLLLIKMRSD